MNVIVLDETQQRTWAELLRDSGADSSKIVQWAERAQETLQKCDLLIVHRTPYLEEVSGEVGVRKEVMDWIESKPSYYLFIAGFDLNPWAARDGRGYRRNASVSPNGVDQAFKRCLKAMIEELKEAIQSERAPNWKIIEPSDPNFYAVTGYLITKSYDMAPALVPNFWEALAKTNAGVGNNYPKSMKEFQGCNTADKDKITRCFEQENGFVDAVIALMNVVAPVLACDKPVALSFIIPKVSTGEAGTLIGYDLFKAATVELHSKNWFRMNRNLLVDLARRFL